MGQMRDLLDWIEGEMTEGEIRELEEGTDQPFLDPAKVDLVSEYQKLNKLLFDEKLGMYPMGWNRNKRNGARVRYERTRERMASGRSRVVNLKILSIEVSTFMAFTVKALRDRLAHEMIHVYWLENGVEYGHDRHFKQEMHRINSMGKGITVSVKESYQDPDLAFQGPGKRRAVFVCKNGSVTIGITVASDKKISEMANAIVFARPRYDLPHNRHWEIYMYDASWLDGFNLHRVPKNQKLPGYSPVRPLRLKEIVEKGVRWGEINESGQLIKGKK